MTLPSFSEFCARWPFTSATRTALEPWWPQAIQAFDGTLPESCRKGTFARVYPLCKGEPVQKILPIAERVEKMLEQDDDLKFLAFMLDFLAFRIFPPLTAPILPDVFSPFGEDGSSVFALMLALGEFQRTRELYEKRGIPPHYAVDALQWLGGNMGTFAKTSGGRLGCSFDFSWIRRHADGLLFRIGRLEYLIHDYQPWMPAVFVNDDGHMALLCRDGWEFDEHGFRIPRSKPPAFTSHLIDDANAVTGTPIAPDGSIDMEHTRTLMLSEWKPAMAPWDLNVSMHIPAGQPMDFDSVKQSMLDAVDFFRLYFHRNVPLLFCNSWIFNPAWEELLPDGNMARFRRECWDFPTHFWGQKAGMLMLFGRNDVSPLELEATTAGQRAFQLAFQKGQIHAGGVVVLTADIPKLGNQFYRQAYGGKS